MEAGEVGQSVEAAVGEVRALLRSRAAAERLLVAALLDACDAGVPRAVLADLLGIHRATLHRQFLSGRSATVVDEPPGQHAG